MKTMSIKALAFTVLERNRKGNRIETTSFQDGDHKSDIGNTGKPKVRDYRIIYSSILNDVLLLADTKEQAEVMRNQGVIEPIYTVQEIPELKKMNEEKLKAVHAIKNVFRGAKVETREPE